MHGILAYKHSLLRIAKISLAVLLKLTVVLTIFMWTWNEHRNTSRYTCTVIPKQCKWADRWRGT